MLMNGRSFLQKAIWIPQYMVIKLVRWLQMHWNLMGAQ